MGIKITFDDQKELRITKGEERTIACYAYDEDTYKPYDLGTNATTLKLKKEDGNCLELNGSSTSASDGLFEIPITALQSVTLPVGTKQSLDLVLVDGANVVIHKQANILHVFDSVC
jgi:hypothetical protein